jgi:hypothetical protein
MPPPLRHFRACFIRTRNLPSLRKRISFPPNTQTLASRRGWPAQTPYEMDPIKERIVGKKRLHDGTPGLRPKLQHLPLFNIALPATPSVPPLRPKVLRVNRKEGKVTSACSPCRKAKRKVFMLHLCFGFIMNTNFRVVVQWLLSMFTLPFF